MLRVMMLCVVALWLPVRALPPTSCTDDSQCSEGYYCVLDATVCRECLSCQDYKREPPLGYFTCIKSVADCGPCNEGLVVDRSGDVNVECVPPASAQLELPYYVWLLIGVAVLLFLALVFGIIAYILRNPEIFKTASSNPSSTVTARITATAPEAPPPYNPLPQTFTSPAYSDIEPTSYNEEEQFIKRAHRPRPQDGRESAGQQAARVYDKPIYEREPRPPSPEPPLSEFADSMALAVHDEDTMPSPWVPGGPTSNGDVNANGLGDEEVESDGGALPALLAAARDSALVEHSAPKKRCVRQDSNNNRNRESNSCGDSNQSSFPRSPSPSAGGPPYSFITQITNVVQINTTK